jgi:hypothetical protein
MSESKTDDRKPVPFDQVVKRLLGTPPAPQEKSGVKRKDAAKRKRAK